MTVFYAFFDAKMPVFFSRFLSRFLRHKKRTFLTLENRPMSRFVRFSPLVCDFAGLGLVVFMTVKTPFSWS
jgi:predicted PurR-regulated permease PerM